MKDLIPRMLMVDPLKRISISEIRQHRWFVHNLPKYLALTADDRLQSSKKIDVEALGKVMALFGIDATKARQRVEQGRLKRNEVTVAYNLVLDTLERQRRNASAGSFLDDMTRNLSSGSDLSELSDGAAPSGSPRVALEDGMDGSGDSQQGAAVADSRDSAGVTGGGLLAPPPPIGGGAMEAAARRPGGDGWRLGKVVTERLPPAAIMMEVYRALGAVGALWKTVSPYLLLPCVIESSQRCTLFARE